MPWAADPARGALRCEFFCRVIDNLGDAAVSWRLARQLSHEHGWQVRLWIDAPTVLAQLVPGVRAGRVHEGVRVERWPTGDGPRGQTPDVVIAAFGCELPGWLRRTMRTDRPVWINLEYLSAEPWVDSHHGLPSPKADGLIEHFFFPGFTPSSGGLIREVTLLAEREAFDADPWSRQTMLSRLGVTVRPGDRLASVFCYPDSPIQALLQTLARRAPEERWRVLVPAGVPVPREGLGEAALALLQPIPFVPQHDYDRLLWCCELNWVRGEDSWVRALWSGRPFIWQAYRQGDQAHHVKLEAFLNHWIGQARPPASAAACWREVHEAWNGMVPEQALHDSLPRLLDRLQALRAAARHWETQQQASPDLAQRLVDFVRRRL